MVQKGSSSVAPVTAVTFTIQTHPPPLHGYRVSVVLIQL